MSKGQLIVLWVTVGLIAAMCLVPPWQYHRASRQLYRPGQAPRTIRNAHWETAGYASVFSPPKRARIDAYRLVAQVIPTALIGGLLMLTLRRRKPLEADDGND